MNHATLTFEHAGATFAVSRSGRDATPSYAVYGPVPLPSPAAGKSPLVLLARRPTRADQRALADGTIRTVISSLAAPGGAGLCPEPYVETRLAEADARKLLLSAPEQLGHALNQRRAVLRVRRGWVHLELSPERELSPAEVQSLVRVVSSVAQTAASLPLDSPSIEDKSWALVASFISAVIGAFTLVWLCNAARFESESAWLPGLGVGVTLAVTFSATLTTLLAVRWIARRALAGQLRAHHRAFGYAMVAALSLGPALGIGVVALNVGVDGAKPEPFVGTVSEFGRTKSGAVGSLCIERAASRRCSALFGPGDSRFGTADPRGLKVAFDVMPGALGLRWVKRVRLVEP